VRGAEFSAAVAVPGKGVSVDVLGAVAADPDGIGFAVSPIGSRREGARACRERGGPFVEPTPENCARTVTARSSALFLCEPPAGRAARSVMREFSASS